MCLWCELWTVFFFFLLLIFYCCLIINRSLIILTFFHPQIIKNVSHWNFKFFWFILKWETFLELPELKITSICSHTRTIASILNKKKIFSIKIFNQVWNQNLCSIRTRKKIEKIEKVFLMPTRSAVSNWVIETREICGGTNSMA